jgi:hypothetical protein
MGILTTKDFAIKYGLGTNAISTSRLRGAVELKRHISNLFTDGMSFDKYGACHIDHKMPLCTVFSKSEVYALCHFGNLQPLWAIDNLKKGNKILA